MLPYTWDENPTQIPQLLARAQGGKWTLSIAMLPSPYHRGI